MRTRSMSNLSKLESLSEELVDRIVSYIASPPDLALVARVSKLLYRITLPYLYATIPLLGSYSDTGSKYIRPLTFLLLQKPELAALVKSFSLRFMYATGHTDESMPEDVEWKNWPQNPDLDEVIRSAVENYAENEERSKKWFEVVRAGYNEASMLALLLPTLTNLRSLDVPFDFEFCGNGTGAESDYIMTMLDLAGRDGLLFRNLTDVSIPGTNDKYPDCPDWFAASIRLPAIKRIYGYNQGNEDRGMENTESVTHVFSKLQPNSSTVEFIELRRSKLSIANFEFLLRAPKSLKTLIYEIGNTWAWTDIKFSAILSALKTQKECLQRLSLGHMPDYFPFIDEEDMSSMSFSDFTSLKQLRAAPIFLYGQDLLNLNHGEGDRYGPPPSQEDLESSKMMLVNAFPSQIETVGFIYCNDPSTLDRLIISLRELLVYRAQFEHLRVVAIHGMKYDVLEEKICLLLALPWKDKGVRFLLVFKPQPNYHEEHYRKRPWGWDEEVEWGEILNDYYDPGELVLYDTEA